MIECYGKNIGTLLRFRTPTVFFTYLMKGFRPVIQSETNLEYSISFFYNVKVAYFFFVPFFAPFTESEPFIRLFDTFIQMLQHIDHLYDCLLRNRIVRYIADTEIACVFYVNHCIFGAVFAVKVKDGIVPFFQKAYDFIQFKAFIVRHSNHPFILIYRSNTILKRDF